MISADHRDRGSESSPSPPVCRPVYRLSTPCDLILDVILVTQFVPKITEGEAKKEILSSVNCLFFISTSLIYGKNPQVRQGIV